MSLYCTVCARTHGGAHVTPTKVFRRLTAAVDETIVKPRVAATVGHKTILKPRLANSDHFPDVKFCVAWLIRAEKAIRFRHQDYNAYRLKS